MMSHLEGGDEDGVDGAGLHQDCGQNQSEAQRGEELKEQAAIESQVEIKTKYKQFFFKFREQSKVKKDHAKVLIVLVFPDPRPVAG